MKKTFLVLALMVAFAAILWMVRNNPAEAPAPPATTVSAGLPAKAREPAAAKATKPEDAANDAQEKIYDAEREKEFRNLEAQEKQALRTPISFYGLVVDQFDKAVPQARVKFASVGGSFEGEREILTQTDGRFSITGIQGSASAFGCFIPATMTPINPMRISSTLATSRVPISNRTRPGRLSFA